MALKREDSAHPESELMRPSAAAAYIDVEERTLEQWRYRQSGPPYVRLGRKTIRYRKSDLDEWIAANLVDPRERRDAVA